MRTNDAAKHGVNPEELPKIILRVCGIAGAKTAIWKRLCFNIRSEITGKTHLKEIYLSNNTKHNIMSYETLKNLGHIREDNTGKHITIMEENTHNNNKDPKMKPHDTIKKQNQEKETMTLHTGATNTTKNTEEIRTHTTANN